ncbi:unnamed protein product [Gongylonema pulchrum]|uniref:Uncharacterized protein n=1 Tax=Gongylonema pulchrum TaxID=637853 RepID=A0A183D232_9BILA|nr:unnamed protein product [Gongylonema pulchrum]
MPANGYHEAAWCQRIRLSRGPSHRPVHRRRIRIMFVHQTNDFRFVNELICSTVWIVWEWKVESDLSVLEWRSENGCSYALRLTRSPRNCTVYEAASLIFSIFLFYAQFVSALNCLPDNF